MNLLTRLTTTGALLLAPAAFAASSFEGKVSMTAADDRGQSHSITYEIKGTSMRVDVEGGQGAMIMDLGKRQMIIIMHQQHMYMVRPMPEAQAHPSQGGDAEPGAARDIPDAHFTGKSEKILGYTCDQFVVKDGDKTTEVWLAQGLGTFMGLGAGGGGPFGRGRSEVAAKWEQVFKGHVGFPMRVITRDASGREKGRMEVTKVDTGGVSDADFMPPEGYRQFQMPNIPGFNPGGG